MNFVRNEFQQIGTDYESGDEVAAYDARMRRMRNVDAENAALLELTGIGPDSSVLEIGTGTGAFARTAAKLCRRVKALDVSQPMLAYATDEAAKEGLKNIAFERAGFLSFDAPANSFDAVVTSLALHHLPDTWKAVALRNIRRWLRPGGVFVLADVVFDWGDMEPEAYFSALVESVGDSKPNMARHIADEYSTTAWIMRGLLEQAGFEIVSEDCEGDFMYFFKCV